MAENLSSEIGPVIVIGQLKIDLPARCVWLNEEFVSLTPLEFDALACLARHAGQCLSPAELLCEVWGCYARTRGAKNQVDCRIKSLRHKLKANPDDPPYILRVRGYGWQMVSDEEWKAHRALSHQ